MYLVAGMQLRNLAYYLGFLRFLWLWYLHKAVNLSGQRCRNCTCRYPTLL